MKKMKAQNVRALTILVVALLVVVGLMTSGGIGNLSALGWNALSLICPLGYLETLLASKLFIPRALVGFLVVVVFIVVLGKVFCAWICPTPLLQRWFPGRKKRENELRDSIELVKDESRARGGVRAVTSDATDTAAAGADPSPTLSAEEKQALAASCEPSACASCGSDTQTLCGHSKAKRIKLDSRHAILGGSLLSAVIFGFPVFCLVCPVGLTFATILIVTRLFSVGDVNIALLVFPIILILELVVFRKWCSKICPLGALVSLFSGLNAFFRPKIDDSKCLVTKEGIDCRVCQKACSRENIDLRRPESSVGALSDCTKCRDCADACPAGAISFPLLMPKGKGNRGSSVEPEAPVALSEES